MTIEEFLRRGLTAQTAVDEAIAGSSPEQLAVFRRVHSQDSRPQPGSPTDEPSKPSAEPQPSAGAAQSSSRGLFDPSQVSCPQCFAGPGRPCIGKISRKPYRGVFHSPRIKAATGGIV